MQLSCSDIHSASRRIAEAIAEGVPARILKDELLALEQRQEMEREVASARSWMRWC
jgi:hypothetical protein